MTQISVPLINNNQDQTSPTTPSTNQAMIGKLSAMRESVANLWSLPDNFTVNTAEAAAMLGRSTRTLEGWRLRHTGPAYQAGGRVTYTVGHLKDFQNKQTVLPHNAA